MNQLCWRRSPRLFDLRMSRGVREIAKQFKCLQRMPCCALELCSVLLLLVLLLVLYFAVGSHCSSSHRAVRLHAAGMQKGRRRVPTRNETVKRKGRRPQRAPFRFCCLAERLAEYGVATRTNEAARQTACRASGGHRRRSAAGDRRGWAAPQNATGHDARGRMTSSHSAPPVPSSAELSVLEHQSTINQLNQTNNGGSITGRSYL